MRPIADWLKRALENSWIYLAIVIVILGATFEVATAGSSVRLVDTCADLITAECEPAKSAAQLEKKSFQAVSQKAQTDYSKYVAYKIVFQGSLESSTDTSLFIAQVAETLGHTKGWGQAGYVFNRVQVANQADFSLTLIQAELLDEIPGCSSQWSCRSGYNVYINEDRWNGATSAWNNAGGNLRDYRHMVVNHEVGHWLGHGHYNCSDSPSNLAPVMQQQSIDLQGCQFNPWPLQFELDAV